MGVLASKKEVLAAADYRHHVAVRRAAGVGSEFRDRTVHLYADLVIRLFAHCVRVYRDSAAADDPGKPCLQRHSAAQIKARCTRPEAGAISVDDFRPFSVRVPCFCGIPDQ